MYFQSRELIASNCNEIKLTVCKDQILDFLYLDCTDPGQDERKSVSKIFNL